MSETRIRIGAQLQARRSQLGWTIKDVARRVGRQPSRVSETETGKANSTIDAVAEMGATMGLSLVFVPSQRVAEVMAMLEPGSPTAVPLPVTPASVFDEVFIPDPEGDDDADH